MRSTDSKNMSSSTWRSRRKRESCGRKFCLSGARDVYGLRLKKTLDLRE
jgi:hypothetical protein